MAALGAAEEIAFELMSKYGAKATVRDYSGRLPVSYLPDTEAGRRMKISKLVIESQPAPQSQSMITSLPPMAPLNTGSSCKDTSSREPLRVYAVKRGGNIFACSPLGRKASFRKAKKPSTELPDGEILSRDDLPPPTPTRITDFPTLTRRNSISRPGIGGSDFSAMVYSTIRRRKTERGKNYNPTDPEQQHTSFRRLPALKTALPFDNKNSPPPVTPQSDLSPTTPISKEQPPITPRVPRSQVRENFVLPPLPNTNKEKNG